MSVSAFILPLVGGVLIGLAAALLLLTGGRIAGISGITSGVLTPRRGDTAWRALFLVGMLAAGGIFLLTSPEVFGDASSTPLMTTVGAGLLVGFGTRLGSGCTSGHGVCGVSRLSPRSLVATAAFMASGAAVVFALRHVFV